MAAEPPVEIALVGDLTDNESDLTQQLLDVEPGGSCVLYIDSPGGNPYAALALASLIRLRGLEATAVVTGECSSSAVWPFAACRRRMVTPLSVLLFHPVKWESAEHVGQVEAAAWARHFTQLEQNMDEMLARLFNVSYSLIHAWASEHRYVTGPEVVEHGLAELVDPLAAALFPPAAGRPRRRQGRRPKSGSSRRD